MAGSRIEEKTTMPFSQAARFAESLGWPLQTFTLTKNPRHRVKINRVIVGVSGCNGGCKVYVTTDPDVQVLSQREIKTGIRVKDQPIVPDQKRKTSTRYLCLGDPRVWIGEDLAIDFVGEEKGIVSFCLRSPESEPVPPEEIKSNHSFNDYPV